MTEEPRDIAHRVTVLAELAERVNAALAAERQHLRDAMLAAGVKVQEVTSGQVMLATVTRVKGRASARVSDPDRLADWVAQHYPEEIVTVRRVRPAFEAAVKRESATAGEPCYRGEADIPGVSVSVSDPTVQLRPTDEAAAEIARLWRAGELDLGSLVPELPGGE